MKFYRYLRRVLWAFTIALLFASSPTTSQFLVPPAFAQPSSPPGLVRELPDLPDHVELPDTAKAGTGRFVDVNIGMLRQDTITINLADGTTLIAERRRLVDNVAGNFVWSGRIQDEPNSQVTIALRKGVVAGSIRRGNTLYELQALEDNVYAIFEVDQESLPANVDDVMPHDELDDDELDDDEAGDDVHAAAFPSISAAEANGPTVIDLMVVYSPAARDANGQASLEARILTAVDYANQAYLDSNVNIHLNLVHMAVVDYTETNYLADAISALQSKTDGKIDEVHAMRDNYGADLVSIVTNNTDTCGWGYTISNPTTSLEHFGFTALRRDCGAFVMAHELGHNLGGQHDRTSSTNSEGALRVGAYPYSHGYRVCNKFATIMAYGCGGSEVAANRFSSPSLTFNGTPIGIDYETDPDNSADMARTLNNMAPIVASFRQAEAVSLPSAPTSLSATAASHERIGLTWVDSSSEEFGFQIERSTNGSTWSQIATVGANVTTYDDTGLDASTAYQYRILAFNSAGSSAYSSVATATTQEPLPVLDVVASSSTATAGTVSGAFGATHSNDDNTQYITEVASGGRPNRRYSYLEHTWTFNLADSDTATLFANAYSGGSSDSDAFVFAYAVNGGSYTNMFTVSSTSSGNIQSFTLPAGTSGAVTVRVRDTDRTARNTDYDRIYVDHLYIRTETSTATTPPNAPANLSANTASSTAIDLTWSDNSDNESGFIIERQSGASWIAVGTVGTNARSFTDSGLTPNTAYTYRIAATNVVGTSSYSTAANATTDSAPAIVEIHVGDLDETATAGSRNRWNATVTITVHDNSENPVANATVSGSWTNGTNGSGSCTTNSSGQCSISKNNLKSNVSSVTLSITDVAHATHNYVASSNHDVGGGSNGTTITLRKTDLLAALTNDGLIQSNKLYLPAFTR